MEYRHFLKKLCHDLGTWKCYAGAADLQFDKAKSSYQHWMNGCPFANRQQLGVSSQMIDRNVEEIKPL